MKKLVFAIVFLFSAIISFSQKDTVLTKKDRKKDVLVQTSMGNMVIRLSDSTPLHRDNFLKLVKTKYYDSILFHRVIKNFMVQAGDPDSKQAPAGKMLGSGGPGYTVQAEFRQTLFHRKGMVSAARMPDDVNPQKASSGSQFYLVQGKAFTDEELDNIENARMGGRKIPGYQREVYKTNGGTPHLDQGYTVFGEVIKGIEVIDAIAAVETSKGADRHRPIADVRIIKMKLVKRKKK
jgi:cyclophilin family peptidyl-prolyl cis-trans isomerase